jgi:hypothetical protein
MNTKEMTRLLNNIILLSDSIDKLRKPNPTDTELYVYNKVKRCFVSLMEMPVEPHNNLEVYEFDRKNKNF